MHDISRGVINNPDEALQGFEKIARTSRPGAFNYTTLSNMVEGAKTFVPSAAGIASFGLSTYGASTGNKNVRAAGDVTGGAVSILQGVQTFGNQALIAETTASLVGKTSTIGLGIFGGSQYFSSSARLLTDQSINPVSSGQWDNTVWIERVGTMTTGIGGAFLAAGAVTAFIPVVGQPVAAVLLPAGLAFVGAGAIMQNWGWVSSIASNLSSTVQQWLSSAANVPVRPTGIQAMPAPIAPTSPATPTATPTLPAADTHPSFAISPTQEAPSPSSSATPTGTPQP